MMAEMQKHLSFQLLKDGSGTFSYIENNAILIKAKNGNVKVENIHEGCQVVAVENINHPEEIANAIAEAYEKQGTTLTDEEKAQLLKDIKKQLKSIR